MSDLQLVHGIHEVIKARHIPGINWLHAEARDGIVYLRGQVNSRYTQWSVLECSRHVTGVRQVVNEVQVAS